MELVYSNTVDDLVGFYMYHYDHDREQRRLQTLVSLVPTIVVLAFVLLQARKGESLIPGLVGVAIALMLAYIIRRLMRQRMLKHARLAYSQGPGRRALGQHTLSLGEEGIVEEAGGGTYTTPWTSVSQVVEMPDVVYIYAGRNAGMVISRGHLRKGDLDAFVSAVRARTGRSA